MRPCNHLGGGGQFSNERNKVPLYFLKAKVGRLHTPLNYISFAIQRSCLRILSFASAVAWDTSAKWVRMSWCIRSFKTGMDEASSYSEKILCSLLAEREQTMTESNSTPEKETKIRMAANILNRWHVQFQNVTQNI